MSSSLKLKWVFPISYFGLETTPLAADGVLYVTGPNQVFALDALTGSALWHYSRPASAGMVGDARLGTNRGVAILRDQGLLCYRQRAPAGARPRQRQTASGRLRWRRRTSINTTAAPWRRSSSTIWSSPASPAPIEGIRGFVAAFKPDTGALVWRHWTVPRRGEPGIETWQGKEPVAGGGSTWLTGSYDPSSDTLYWPTGNPWPDGDDRDRPGDNLYTNCVLALNARTGELKWHYQFTPHDVKDRDATEPNVLVDSVYKGKPSKLLLHADRNGFFYVLDRTNWRSCFWPSPSCAASTGLRSIGPDGRPVVNDPRGCPSDAANWDSTAFSPETRLYYFMALEECTGKPTGYPDQTGQRFLRAVNIETGEIAWEVAQPGPARAKTWSGVLATAGGLIFYGQPNGGFAAVDQRNGKTLWQFPTNVRMKALAHDFQLRRQPVRRGGGRSEYPLLRTVNVIRRRAVSDYIPSGCLSEDAHGEMERALFGGRAEKAITRAPAMP